jgi:dTDP-glucose 4,6-dehydratase
MKLLVSGGAGFIGSAICRHAIVALGWEIVVVDKLTYAGHMASLAPVSGSRAFAFERADVGDRSAMDAILRRHRPHAIMHLAAESHVDRSIVQAVDFIQTNVVGTFTLLEAARDYWDDLDSGARERFRFLHISTDEVYGSLGAGRFAREDDPFSPSSPYAASKAASDHLVLAWHRTYGLPGIVTHCANNYGPYHLPEKLIPLMILNALDHLPLPVYGDGRNVREWLYVDDTVRALLLVLDGGRAGETYNIGVPSERTNIEVVERICDLLDRHHPSPQSHRSLIRYVADRPGHDRRYATDATKIMSELGWHAEVDFETGLEKTVLWYLANRDWWEPIRLAGRTTGPAHMAASEPEG